MLKIKAQVLQAGLLVTEITRKKFVTRFAYESSSK